MSAWWRGILVGAVAGALVAGAGFAVSWRTPDGPGPEFVTRVGDRFMLQGKPFAAAGSNNYRPMFLEPAVVDDIMKAAADNNFQIMRVWAFNDIGRADGSESVDIQNTTTYFHYWDGNAPAFNDGDTGLAKLDYVVASAKRHGATPTRRSGSGTATGSGTCSIGRMSTLE